MHCRRHGRRGAVHFADDPVLECGLRVLQVQPVAEGLPAPFADAVDAHGLAGVGAVQRVDALDAVGDAGRGVAQHEAGEPLRMGGGEQQADQAAGGLADPVDFGQRQGVEDGQDLGCDGLRGVAVAVWWLVGEAAAEQVGAVDAVGFCDGRDPAVPEQGVAGEAVHHQDRGGGGPGPEVVVDGAVEGWAVGEGDFGHWRFPMGWLAAGDGVVLGNRNRLTDPT